MPRYKLSTGEYLDKKIIDRKVREAKRQKLAQQREERGYNYCEDCKSNGSGTYLDCSHEISVDRCQKEGRAELAYDTGNIKIRCRECHREHDKL